MPRPQDRRRICAYVKSTTLIILFLTFAIVVGVSFTRKHPATGPQRPNVKVNISIGLGRPWPTTSSLSATSLPHSSRTLTIQVTTKATITPIIMPSSTHALALTMFMDCDPSETDPDRQRCPVRGDGKGAADARQSTEIPK